MEHRRPESFVPQFSQPGRGHEDGALSRRTTRVFTSDSLFEGTYEVGIRHNGSLYRLKITRQGKLILNK